MIEFKIDNPEIESAFRALLERLFSTGEVVCAAPSVGVVDKLVRSDKVTNHSEDDGQAQAQAELTQIKADKEPKQDFPNEWTYAVMGFIERNRAFTLSDVCGPDANPAKRTALAKWIKAIPYVQTTRANKAYLFSPFKALKAARHGA